jgi:hypothetical protein
MALLVYRGFILLTFILCLILPFLKEVIYLVFPIEIRGELESFTTFHKYAFIRDVFLYVTCIFCIISVFMLIRQMKIRKRLPWIDGIFVVVFILFILIVAFSKLFLPNGSLVM